MASTPHIVISGLVLRETETKETDKILTLLTAERGKLSVIARRASGTTPARGARWSCLTACGAIWRPWPWGSTWRS